MEKIILWSPVAARIAMGLFYWVMAAGLIKDFKLVTGLMASRGVPLQTPLLTVTIIAWLAGGAALAFNWHTAVAAICLFVLTLAITPIIHNFWSAPPEMFANELQHFFKNVAILAGLLAIVAISSGTARA
jgi:putative oxidoreductase